MNEKEATVGRWQKEFFENINGFMKSGLNLDEAKQLLEKFLYLSSTTPLPKVMDTFKDPEQLEKVGVYTESTDIARNFMLQFLSPIMKNFTVSGIENLELVERLIGKYPITLISNHLSHLDAPGIYYLIHNSSPVGQRIANQMVFIAGRLAFEPDFTRLGLYMFGTLLVCSKKDMSDNPSLSDLMTKINMRAFRHSQKLQSDGKIISIFPEGTRSRDGRLMPFVDTVYHYVANKIVLPVSLEGTDKILPTSGFLFNAVPGKLTIGRPVIVGELHAKGKEPIPFDIEQITFPEMGDKKQFLIDNLALLVGSNLSRHKHGSYRNLYNADKFIQNQNVLISIPKQPDEHVVVIGSTNTSVATAAILSNKNVLVTVYHPDEKISETCNSERRDIEHYPLYKLPPNLTFTSDPSVFRKATLFIQGTNPWQIDDTYPKIIEELKANPAVIINVIKGFSSVSTKGLILNHLAEKYGIPHERFSAAAGAGFPDQIIERKISGLEFACINHQHLNRLVKLFSTSYIFTRPAIVQTDVIGVQLGGALKTIYALTMGLVEGYFKENLGGNVDNTLFHLSNRFFKEMVSIGVALGGNEQTFNGLSGLTDFMLACFGSDPRDRMHGHDIVLGKPHEKMSNGYHGLTHITRLIPLDKQRYPILTSAHEVVIQNKNIDNIIQGLQEQLTRL